MANKKDFAAAFRSARMRSGETQEETAKILGVSQQSLCRWEATESFPRPAHWQKIRQRLGVDPAEYHEYTNITQSDNSGIAVAGDGNTVVEGSIPLGENWDTFVQLFRQYGSNALLKKWIKELEAERERYR